MANKESSFLRAKAEQYKANEVLTPTNDIVITGYAAITPFGDAEKTYDAMLNGESVGQYYDASNDLVNIAGPINFDPSEHFDRQTLRGLSHLAATTLYVSKEALNKAGLLDRERRLVESVNKLRISSHIASGIGSTPEIVEVDNRLFKGVDKEKYYSNNTDPEERTQMDEIIRKNSRAIGPFSGLEIFPEGINGNVAIRIAKRDKVDRKNKEQVAEEEESRGAQGWGSTSVEACSTGLSSIVDGAEKIRTGRSDIAIVGGAEDILSDPKRLGLGKTGISLFARMGVLSNYNDQPHKASRPFDRDRRGFLMSAGSSVLILENGEHARRRGAKILAEVRGFDKSMDGYKPTEIDVENGTRTWLRALYDLKDKDFRKPDVLWTHATATEVGDELEAQIAHNVFGNEYLPEILVTAIKGNLGHEFGAAGSINAVSAVQSFERNAVPHILNLDNPQLFVGKEEDLDEKRRSKNKEIEKHILFARNQPIEMQLNTAFVLGYGFRGYNAAIFLQKPTHSS